MLDRLRGNAALKQDLGLALRSGRLAHSILFIGEPGCGAGFAARCLAADYLYPGGGPHAEAVLRGEDTECISLRGEGASGQIRVDKVRDARNEIQRSALSTNAAGRVLFIYGAQNLNVSSANAMLKLMEEPPDGAMFLLTAASAATVLPTIRSRCAAYTVAPVTTAECAAALPDLPAQKAEELSFLYEGHIGTCLNALQEDACKTTLAAARQLCACAARQDGYLAMVTLSKFEKERDKALLLFWQLAQLCSACLRRPGFWDLFDPGDAQRPARVSRAAANARRAVAANGNLRLALTVLAAELTGA